MARLGARVLRGVPLPPGWVGKSWACAQLTGAALGNMLIFTDADVFWRPGTRLLTPLMDAAVLGWLPYPLLRTYWPLARVANGQLMAFQRGAYWRAGGHAAVRAEILEDTQLARRLKAAGGPGRARARAGMRGGHDVPGLPRVAARLRQERAGRASRLARPLLGLGLWHLLAYTLPWLWPASPGIWALRVAGLSERALVNLVSGRRHVPDLAERLLGPLTPLLALLAYTLALRRTVRWKDHEYPAH